MKQYITITIIFSGLFFLFACSDQGKNSSGSQANALCTEHDLDAGDGSTFSSDDTFLSSETEDLAPEQNTETPAHIFQPGEIQEKTALLKFTQAGLDFFKARFVTLLKANPGIKVDSDNIAHVDFENEFNDGVIKNPKLKGEFLLHLENFTEHLDIQFAKTADDGFNGIKVELNDIKIGIDAIVSGEAEVNWAGIKFNTDAACKVENDVKTDGPIYYATKVDLIIKVIPSIDGEKHLQLEVKAEEPHLDELNIEIKTDCELSQCKDDVMGEPACFECSTIACPASDLLQDVIVGIGKFIQPLIKNALIDNIEKALRETLKPFNDQPVKFETTFNPQTLAGDNSSLSLNGNELHLSIRPEVNGVQVSGEEKAKGMDLFLEGAVATQKHGCVPDLPFPDFLNGVPPVLTGLDKQGNVYHLAFVFAKAYMNRLLFTLFQSGLLCQALNTNDILNMTNGAFALRADTLTTIIPELSDYARDDSPVMIGISPQNPPLVEFGDTEKGESLLSFSFENFRIAIYVDIFDRMVRLLQFKGSLSLQIDVKILSEEQKAKIFLKEIKLYDFHEEFKELIPDMDFDEIFKILTDTMAKSVLTDQEFSIDLPSLDSFSQALCMPLEIQINEFSTYGSNQEKIEYLKLFVTIQEKKP